MRCRVARRTRRLGSSSPRVPGQHPGRCKLAKGASEAWGGWGRPLRASSVSAWCAQGPSRRSLLTCRLCWPPRF